MSRKKKKNSSRPKVAQQCPASFDSSINGLFSKVDKTPHIFIPVSHVESRFNHSPFVTDVWVEYNGARFKDPYQIRLNTGEEIEASPNGGGWHLPDNRIVEDSEVTHVKLLSKPMQRRWHTGARKLIRQFEYFGTRYPAWVGDQFIKETELPDGYRFSPTEVYGYRDKEGKIKIMVSRAKVVEQHSTEPSITDILSYTNDPLFWWEGYCDVMNHDDICRAIHYVHMHREHIKSNPADASWLNQLMQRYTPSPRNWIPIRQIAVQILEERGRLGLEATVIKPVGASFVGRWKMLKEQERGGFNYPQGIGEVRNELRTGNNYQVCDNLDIAKVLHNPETLPLNIHEMLGTL